MTKLERISMWIETARARFCDGRARSAARGLAFVGGAVLLALVGSGRFARWLTPSADLGIHVAEAAPAPSSIASTPAIVAPRPPAAALEAAPIAASDPASTEPALDPGDGGATSAGVAPDGKVILNLANEDDLRRLPGIGHGRAQAILALRGQLKKFTRVEDLLKVKGIGRRGLARIRPLVRID